MKLYLSDTSKPEILIYSKNPEEANSLKALLNPEEYIISLETEEWQKITQKSPDLVIILSDFAILETLCEKLDTIPILIVLDSDEEKQIRYALASGVNDFIIKPVNALQLSIRAGTLINTGRSQQEILKKYRENQELLTFREEIMRIIIHDMGNNVSGIIGSIDLLALQSANFNDKQLKNLTRANESAKELLQIIKNICDIVNRNEESFFTCKQFPVDMKEIINQLTVTMKSFFNYSKRELVIEMPDTAITVKSNENLLKRVMESLIGNAIKNTPSNGKVTISVEKSPCSSFLEIRVKDQGKPLPEEFRRKIFSLYGQLEIFDAGYRIGRGFSTSFCKIAVNNMGGNIWMEDTGDEQANCFVFTLPLIN